ncbi:MAG: YfhO family protein [Chloroflexi bacterium]|nr:YfhO family protein [Chloroflexota bacterium]
MAPDPSQNPKTKIQNWNAALVGLVALDLLVFAYDFHPRATLETLGQPGPLLQALAEQGGARLLAGPGIAALEPNRPLLAGLDDLSGYSSLPNQRHFDYWSRARATPNVLLDLWGAGLYISSDDQPDAVQREGYTLYPTQPLLEGSAGGPAGEEAFRVPDVAATEVRLVGSLSHAVEVAEGSLVGEVVVVDTAGRVRQLPLRAGQHLAERAYDRADVSPAVRHSRPPVLYSTEEWSVDGSLFPVHAYLARLPLGERVAVSRLVVRALGTQGELNVFGLALAEGDGAPSYSVRPTDREKLQPLRRVGSASIYRNTRAFPRAFVVAQAVGLDPAHRESPLVQMLSSPFDPAQEVLLERFPEPLPLPSQVPRASELSYLIPAQVEELSTEHVRVRADLGAAGFLVLTDLYHRGWQARVDGQSAPLYLADSLFRAVPVPAGQHVVDFVFDPISLRLGAFLSLEALLFAALLLAGPALARWVGRLKGMPVRV